MGLPGKPTFTDLRTSIATHARNTLSSNSRSKVTQFMCHDTSTADKFYAMNLSANQAMEHRRLFEQALSGVEVSPVKPAEADEGRKRTAKTKRGGGKRRREESPPTSPSVSSSSSSSETEEKAVPFQESGVSSLDSPSSPEEYPRTYESDDPSLTSSPSHSSAGSQSGGSSSSPEVPEGDHLEPDVPEPAAEEPASPEPAPQEPASPERAPQEPASPERAPQEPASPERAPQETASPLPTPGARKRRRPVVLVSPLKNLKLQRRLSGIARATRARAKMRKAVEESDK